MVLCFRGIRLPNFATNSSQTQLGRARRKQQSHLFPMKSNLRFSYNSHCAVCTTHKAFIYSQSQRGDLLMPIKTVKGSDSYQTRERMPAGWWHWQERCVECSHTLYNITLNMQQSCEIEDSCWCRKWECWRIELFSILFFPLPLETAWARCYGVLGNMYIGFKRAWECICIVECLISLLYVWI